MKSGFYNIYPDLVPAGQQGVGNPTANNNSEFIDLPPPRAGMPINTPQARMIAEQDALINAQQSPLANRDIDAKRRRLEELRAKAGAQ